MVVAIGNDHRGLKLKNEIINHFKNITFINVGTNDELPADHPIYAFKVGEMVTSKQAQFGILICGTGIGMSIACNKVKNIRCAKVDTCEEAKLTREHNDANVLALSSKLPIEEVFKIVDTFLNTETLTDEKYLKRRNMIERYEHDH